MINCKTCNGTSRLNNRACPDCDISLLRLQSHFTHSWIMKFQQARNDMLEIQKAFDTKLLQAQIDSLESSIEDLEQQLAVITEKLQRVTDETTRNERHTQ